MPELKHTAGPLIASGYLVLEKARLGSPLALVAQCLSTPERTGAEVQANALLFAAAPDLAEALASLVWDVNNGLDPKRSLELAYAAQEKAGLI